MIFTPEILKTKEIIKKEEINRLLDQLVLYGLRGLFVGGIFLAAASLNSLNVIQLDKSYLISLIFAGDLLFAFGLILVYLGYKKLKLEFK